MLKVTAAWGFQDASRFRMIRARAPQGKIWEDREATSSKQFDQGGDFSVKIHNITGWTDMLRPLLAPTWCQLSKYQDDCCSLVYLAGTGLPEKWCFHIPHLISAVTFGRHRWSAFSSRCPTLYARLWIGSWGCADPFDDPTLRMDPNTPWDCQIDPH